MTKSYAETYASASGASTDSVSSGLTVGGLPGPVWSKACATLRLELGDDKFGSWLAQATPRETGRGDVVLVTPTGIARDWIRRNAWRRVSELWAQHDPLRRPLELKSKVEFENDPAARSTPEAGLASEARLADVVALNSPTTDPAPCAPVLTTLRALDDGSAAARASRVGALQDRLTFDTFVAGPANEFAHAVARRVASWSDGHFNPVVFHGPYGFGKTHLLNAIAWEAMRSAPERKAIAN